MSARDRDDRYECPRTGFTFDRWRVKTVSPHGNAVFECPFCGATKTDSSGQTREDHLRGGDDG